MPLTTREMKIVIIDDDEDDFYIIADYLRAIEGNIFVIDWCNNYQDGLKLLRQRKYDTIICHGD